MKKLLTLVMLGMSLAGFSVSSFADHDRGEHADHWDRDRDRDRDRGSDHRGDDDYDHDYDRDRDGDRDHRDDRGDRDGRDHGREDRWDRDRTNGVRAACTAVALGGRFDFRRNRFTAVAAGQNLMEARRRACFRALNQCEYVTGYGMCRVLRF